MTKHTPGPREMIATRYAVINAEGETIRTVVASTFEAASKKVKHLYPDGWPFVRLAVQETFDIKEAHND